MPVKRLKQKTMKKHKKTKTKKTKTKKNTRKQKTAKSKSIMNSSMNSSIIHSNMDSMYNNSSMDSSNMKMQNHNVSQQNLINLIAKISKERQNRTKSQSNLVARIMKMPNMSRMSKPKTYAKTVSSYYSTVSHNGESHNKGKKIVNESTNPYLEIDEMRDGQVKHYMLSKNSIPYREPIQEVLPRMNMQMQMQEPKILLEYYPHSRQNKKYKKKSKTHKK
jgi:hypothetical protein